MFPRVWYKTGLLPVKCYIGILFVRLWIILCALIYTNKHFWRRCRGNGCWVNFEPSLTLYHYSFIFFYHGSKIHRYLPKCSTYECTLTATRICKAYPNTRLWATPVFNLHGPGSILFRQKWWKSLFPPKWIWVDLYMPTHSRHVRWNITMEAFSILFDGKS